MTVTSCDTDLETLTLTLVSDFSAPVERVWRLWSDPRVLEGWWGPPTYPATVEEHDLVPGGAVTYYMTGPQGDRHHGWWKVVAVSPPTSLEFVDGFADADGTPSEKLRNTTRVEISEHDGGTRMVTRSTFASEEEMRQLMGMGMEEGMREAAGQIDALLRD
ncbi:SRPBCC domain-containing protein [Nocardiopsis sp. MG754419]|uniref:SRPBCC family protein n=1 Tax=Nocardiopsis sp. MG754419 TaxID=2259865 RepID=UPI001BABB927|nr:SRPBCC domain-containing protein [Nocardiopsis sp. MG754419]MBR8741375.1 SRPBCC domain-containing protein [Nocardiopsis sp. MG754419]